MNCQNKVGENLKVIGIKMVGDCSYKHGRVVSYMLLRIRFTVIDKRP